MKNMTFKQFVMRWMINSAALVVATVVVPGIVIVSLPVLLVAALVLGLMNIFLRPLLIFITLPVTILSFGVFALFINAFLLYLAAELISGFTVSGFWSAFFGALVFGIVSSVLSAMTGAGGTRIRFYRGPRPPRSGGGGDSRGRDNVIDAEVVERDGDRPDKGGGEDGDDGGDGPRRLR